MRRLPSLVLVAVVSVAGCATRPKTEGAVVARSEVVPRGFWSLGEVRAACRPTQGWQKLSDVPARSLFCGRDTLDQALEEQARARGATLLAARRCAEDESGTLVCTAVAARACTEHGSAPPPPLRAVTTTDSDDLSAELGARVAIDLEPSVPAFSRRARTGAEVHESALLPVGQVELGVMRARCHVKTCDADQTRAALRAAAGGLGVPELIGVRCFAYDEELSCVATLAASELDPETDPSAR